MIFFSFFLAHTSSSSRLPFFSVFLSQREREREKEGRKACDMKTFMLPPPPLFLPPVMQDHLQQRKTEWETSCCARTVLLPWDRDIDTQVKQHGRQVALSVCGRR